MAQVRADTLDPDTVDILTQLNFIGSIKPFHYVNVKDLTLAPKTSYSFLTIAPFRWRESRDRFTDLDDINDVVIQGIAKLRGSKGDSTYSQILFSLMKVEQGLQNFVSSYPGDTGVKSRADAIISNIDTVISTSEIYDL